MEKIHQNHIYWNQRPNLICYTMHKSIVIQKSLDSFRCMFYKWTTFGVLWSDRRRTNQIISTRCALCQRLWRFAKTLIFWARKTRATSGKTAAGMDDEGEQQVTYNAPCVSRSWCHILSHVSAVWGTTPANSVWPIRRQPNLNFLRSKYMATNDYQTTNTKARSYVIIHDHWQPTPCRPGDRNGKGWLCQLLNTNMLYWRTYMKSG